MDIDVSTNIKVMRPSLVRFNVYLYLIKRKYQLTMENTKKTSIGTIRGQVDNKRTNSNIFTIFWFYDIWPKKHICCNNSIRAQTNINLNLISPHE